MSTIRTPNTHRMDIQSSWQHTQSAPLNLPCTHFESFFPHIHLFCCQCGCRHDFTLSLIVPPCGQTNECHLPNECNKCLLCAKCLISISTFLYPVTPTGEVMMLVLWWRPPETSTNQKSRPLGLLCGGVPHHLLLSRMALQSSDQETSRLWEGLTDRCLLWQAVNRMCSHVGLGSTPNQDIR